MFSFFHIRTFLSSIFEPFFLLSELQHERQQKRWLAEEDAAKAERISELTVTLETAQKKVEQLECQIVEDAAVADAEREVAVEASEERYQVQIAYYKRTCCVWVMTSGNCAG